MRLFKVVILALFLFTSITITGCRTASQGSKTYTPSQAQSSMSVYEGTVLKIAEVQIQKDASGIGAVGGGVVGGIVGNTIGSGRGNTLATTAGALVGVAAGSAAEKAHGTKPALEIEVKLDDGRIMVIVQEQDEVFAVGDRIRLLQSSDGTMRVRR